MSYQSWFKTSFKWNLDLFFRAYNCKISLMQWVTLLKSNDFKRLLSLKWTVSWIIRIIRYHCFSWLHLAHFHYFLYIFIWLSFHNHEFFFNIFKLRLFPFLDSLEAFSKCLKKSVLLDWLILVTFDIVSGQIIPKNLCRASI